MELQVHPLQQAYDRVWKEIVDLYHNLAQAQGLSDSAFSVLFAMAELEDGCLQRDICDCCSLSKQTVHSAVQKLEAAGILRLEPGRGRDKHLFLTEAGRLVLRGKILPISQAESATFSALTPEEGQTLVRLTQKYLALLREKTQSITDSSAVNGSH